MRAAIVIICIAGQVSADVTDKECYSLGCYYPDDDPSPLQLPKCITSGCNGKIQAFFSRVQNHPKPDYAACARSICWHKTVYSTKPVPYACVVDGCYSRKALEDWKLRPGASGRFCLFCFRGHKHVPQNVGGKPRTLQLASGGVRHSTET